MKTKPKNGSPTFIEQGCSIILAGMVRCIPVKHSGAVSGLDPDRAHGGKHLGPAYGVWLHKMEREKIEAILSALK